jgi:DNA recombination protein RmuC
MYLLSGIAGCIASLLLFYWYNKAKSIPRTDYDLLFKKFNETNTLLKITEDRLSSKNEEFSKLSLRSESKEVLFTDLQARSSSWQTILRNQEQKILELSDSLGEQTSLQATQQERIHSLQQQIARESALNHSLTENLKLQKETIARQVLQIEQLTEKAIRLNSRNSELAARNQALEDKLSTQKDEILEIQKKSHLEFEKIAGRILEEKSGKFTQSNKENMEALLKPLGENIDRFKQKVEETYDKESKQRFSLEEKVKELVEQTNKVSNEANNLASALKGQSKKQGNWGEIILESILQKSGLQKDREYFLQQTLRDEEGKNLRPDVLVKLPDDRIIIIDSKVSLLSYDRFSASEAIEEQSLHLAAHMKSVYGHIDDLHEKKYDNLESSLDFTMMFIPIEPAYLLAIQSDPDLWAYAYAKRILLISPTNLIACLKLMADLWKRELQSKNALEIVKRGELLYEKFVAFASSLEDIGKHISKTQTAYTNAIGQLNSGSGHLVGQALKLKNLGLKSSREIPVSLLPMDFEETGAEGTEIPRELTEGQQPVIS